MRALYGRAPLLAALTIVAAALAAATASASAPATPPCFGAAARDPLKPCDNPTLAVFPGLDEEDPTQGGPCVNVDENPTPMCYFGPPARRARRHAALIGDSHALAWRAALDVVARNKRWQVYSVTTAGCFFSAAVVYLAEGVREYCTLWYRTVLAWLRDHPEIDTIFLSSFASMPLLEPRGRTYLQTKLAGLQRAFGAMPKTIKHIVVIRDAPLISVPASDCLRGVIAEGTEPPGLACRDLRRGVLGWDTALSAVRLLHSRRLQGIDLSEFFCDALYCYPVIGGVLVHRDIFGHMTVAYSQSLAPYLERKLDRLMRRW